MSFMKERNTGKYSENTYVVSVGKKGDDHSVIEDLLSSNLDSLNTSNNKWFSCSERGGRKVKVRIYIYASLGDSPEKYTISHICRGNGTYTSRFGFSINMKYAHKYLPACKRCRKDSLCKLVDVNYICNRKCKKCVNWEFFNDPYKLLVSPVPANLPEDSNLVKEGNLNQQ